MLAVNHSTVFRRLAALEEDLQVRLFEKHAHGYVLTQAGERMLVLGRDVDASVNKIQLELTGRDLEVSGKVRVTTAPNLARTVMPVAQKKLRKQHPDLVLELAVGDSDFDLARREADIALRATTRPPEQLVGKRLTELQWWVCAGKRERKVPKNLQQIGNHALIGADSELLRLPVFSWLETQYSQQVVSRCNDLSTMAALAATGVGLALLPSDQCEERMRRLFALSDFRSELWLLTHPDLRFTPRIRAVWNAIESSVHQLIQ